MSVATSSLQAQVPRTIPYDGSNFMPFPQATAHFFPPGYVDRRGNPLSPFVMPHGQATQIDITAYSPYITTSGSPYEK